MPLDATASQKAKEQPASTAATRVATGMVLHTTHQSVQSTKTPLTRPGAPCYAAQAHRPNKLCASLPAAQQQCIVGDEVVCPCAVCPRCCLAQAAPCLQTCTSQSPPSGSQACCKTLGGLTGTLLYTLKPTCHDLLQAWAVVVLASSAAVCCLWQHWHLNPAHLAELAAAVLLVDGFQGALRGLAHQ